MLKQRFNISLDRKGRVLDTLQVSSKLQNGRANVLSMKKEERKNACLCLTKRAGVAGGHN